MSIVKARQSVQTTFVHTTFRTETKPDILYKNKMFHSLFLPHFNSNFVRNAIIRVSFLYQMSVYEMLGFWPLYEMSFVRIVVVPSIV